MRWMAGLLSLVLAAVATAAPTEPSFVPVYRDDFPDAFVVQQGGSFIAYATNNGLNLPMIISPDLVHWTPVTDPATGKRADGMPVLASWVKGGFTWAPEVLHLGNKWLLYYTASYRARDMQCIGVAVADVATGPFRDGSAGPIVCQADLGGSIDADAFRDADGKLYLYFKNDGNRVSKRTAIWGQQLAPDGMAVVGAPVQLLSDDDKWEERVVEAPTMVRSPTGYAMFYSGGYFGWNPEDRLSPYALGYATCSGPLGPCKDSPDNPILHSFNDREAGCLSGPGHQSIFQVGLRTFMSFHAWAATSGCRKLEDERYLYVAPLFWKDGKPQIGNSMRER
jgi:beta-xylosidase